MRAITRLSGVANETSMRERPAMKTMTVDDSLYQALEEAANRNERPVQDLLNEAIESWLAEAAMDDADHSAIERSRAEASRRGGVESEAFFEGLLTDPDCSRDC